MDLDFVSRIKLKADNWNDLVDAFDKVRPSVPYGVPAQAVIDYLLGDRTDTPSIPLAPIDAPLFKNLSLLRTSIDWENLSFNRERSRQFLTSPVEDELLVGVMPDSWTNLFILNHILLSKIVPTRNSAVVVAMRNDGVRILEWVSHYLALGFEGIFIYTNDNDDMSEGLLEVLSNLRVVTLINNEVSGKVSPQAKAFEHSLRLLPELRQYKWVFYADSDELLRLKAEDDFSINRIIRKVEESSQKPPAAILYNWKWFVSGNRFEQSNMPLIETFTHSIPHKSFKSMVRLPAILSMIPLHFPVCCADEYYVDSALSVVPESTHADKGKLWSWADCQYGGCQLNHYWNKSFEEYAIKKRRGDLIESNSYDYKFNLFFEWNEAETDDNLDQCDELFLGRVYRQIFQLRQDRQVVLAELEIREAHGRMLDCYGGVQGLRKMYGEYLADFQQLG